MGDAGTAVGMGTAGGQMLGHTSAGGGAGGRGASGGCQATCLLATTFPTVAMWG